MPTTTNFGQTYVTPLDPAYSGIWGPIYNALHVFWDSVTGKRRESIFIETPTAKDYRVILNERWGGAITKVTTRTSAGTATVQVKINTTALGGTANSASTAEQEQNHASANTYAAGDDIVLTLSSVSSDCADLSITLWMSRTSAGS